MAVGRRVVPLLRRFAGTKNIIMAIGLLVIICSLRAFGKKHHETVKTVKTVKTVNEGFKILKDLPPCIMDIVMDFVGQVELDHPSPLPSFLQDFKVSYPLHPPGKGIPRFLVAGKLGVVVVYPYEGKYLMLGGLKDIRVDFFLRMPDGKVLAVSGRYNLHWYVINPVDLTVCKIQRDYPDYWPLSGGIVLPDGKIVLATRYGKYYICHHDKDGGVIKTRLVLKDPIDVCFMRNHHPHNFSVAEHNSERVLVFFQIGTRKYALCMKIAEPDSMVIEEENLPQNLFYRATSHGWCEMEEVNLDLELCNKPDDRAILLYLRDMRLVLFRFGEEEEDYRAKVIRKFENDITYLMKLSRDTVLCLHQDNSFTIVRF